MSGHTPTPWKVLYPSLNISADVPCSGVLAGVCRWCAGLPSTVPGVAFDLSRDEQEANARFIVRACNSHEKLVEAIEQLLDTFYGGGDRTEGHEMAMQRQAYAAARAALALAEGGQQ